MEQVEHAPLRKRALQEIGGVIADGAYASLLAIPVAIGVAVYTFVYLSLLRHRLRRRAEQRIGNGTHATADAGDE
jgi:hypothetical protein